MSIILILLVIVAVLAIVIAKQPADFRITRSARMTAPPAKVFEQVNDLHKWEAWSPWAKLDPNAKTMFAGAPTGVGAVMQWDGSAKVGAGGMTIIESRPSELIRLRLDFLRPMKATNTAEFTFRPEGNQTMVSWSMAGTNNFIGKAMSLVFNCEKMVGGQFDKGLAQLKAVAESA